MVPAPGGSPMRPPEIGEWSFYLFLFEFIAAPGGPFRRPPEIGEWNGSHFYMIVKVS